MDLQRIDQMQRVEGTSPVEAPSFGIGSSCEAPFWYQSHWSVPPLNCLNEKAMNDWSNNKSFTCTHLCLRKIRDPTPVFANSLQWPRGKLVFIISIISKSKATLKSMMDLRCL